MSQVWEAVALLSIAFASLKGTELLVNIIIAKFVTSDTHLGRSVSNLISIVELKDKCKTADDKYSIKTVGYVITIQKREKNNK